MSPNLRNMTRFTALLGFLIVCQLNAQSRKKDSLRNIINTTNIPAVIADTFYEYAYSFSSKNLDSTIYYLKRSYAIATDTAIDSIRLKACVALSKKYYHQISDIDSTHYYLNLGYAINESVNDSEQRYKLHTIKAYIYESTGRFDNAIALHLQNIAIADSIKNYEKKAFSFSGIADVYRLQKNGVKAVEYMELAKETIDQLDSIQLLTKIKIGLNLALAYDGNNQRKKGIELMEALVPNSIKQGPFTEAIAYHNLGRMYIISERFEEAEEYLLKAMVIPEWSETPRRKAATLKELTTLYVETHRPKEAVLMGEQAYEMACQLEVQYHIEDATRNLSNAYELNGQYKESLALKKEYIAIIKDIFNDDKNSLMLDLDAKYQTSEKEKKIQQLTAINSINKRDKVIWILASILIISILISVWFYQRKKSSFIVSQKELKIKTQEDEKNLIALRLKNEQILSEKQRQEKNIMELELKLKDKELTTNAMSLLQQKEHYESLIQKLKSIHMDSNDEDATNKISALINETKASLRSYNWEEFQYVFEKVHIDFYNKLLMKFPGITPNEKKLSAFIKLGMSTKDISAITNQTPHSILIARSRLRKKLGLNTEDSLSQYINTF